MPNRTKPKQPTPKDDPNVPWVTLEEYLRRRTAWNNYFEKVHETEAFHLYEVSRGAWADQNGDLVRDCAHRARQLRESGQDKSMDLLKPDYADPVVEKASRRLKIKYEENET